MNVAIAAAVFPVIFVGELPDKTMVASLLLSTRGRAGAVWAGAAAAFVIHVAIATTAGALAFRYLPQQVMGGLVAAVFLAGAFLAAREAWRERHGADGERGGGAGAAVWGPSAADAGPPPTASRPSTADAPPPTASRPSTANAPRPAASRPSTAAGPRPAASGPKSGRPARLAAITTAGLAARLRVFAAALRCCAAPARTAGTAFAVIFAAEWGDLTQMLTANLAAHYHSPMSVAAGALLALWSVAALAVVGGRRLARVVRPFAIRIGTAGLLTALGVYAAWTALA